MSRVTLERPCGADAARALRTAEASLVKSGYEVVARSAASVNLLATTADRHRLGVSAHGGQLRFEFEPAVPGQALPAAELLAARADAASGGGAPAGAGSARRCELCATLVPAGASACPTCGMTAPA